MNAPSSTRRGLRILFLAGLVLGAALSLSSATVYDLVQKAPEAKWGRSLAALGELPWNGPNNDARGFARHLANVPLESGKTFALVLETHPEWKSGGMIYGVYSNVQVPAKAKFSALVGFLKGATATDGATFEVHVFDQTTGAIQLIAAKAARADGVLDELAADLGAYAGRSIRELSQGQRRRAVFATAMIGRPAHLLLDEPLEAMDLKIRGEILSWLTRRLAEGASAVVIPHDIEPFAGAVAAAVGMKDGRARKIELLPEDLAEKIRLLDALARGEA